MSVSTSKAPDRIAGMFDAIARRYDTLNHVLSAGLDKRWRARAIRELALSGRERVLDVCTGTGDLAIAAVTSPAGRAAHVVGVDFSGEMLRYGREKVRAAGLGARIGLARGDAMRLPVPNAAFDVAMVAFGIRNVSEPARSLAEFHRALKPGGRLAILEFGFPRIPGIRTLYTWYFKYVLPRVGKAVSKHGEAYSYLPASVAEFPSDEGFAERVRAAGFTSVRYIPLTFGIVYLYLATRPE